MATSALLRALRRPSSEAALRLATSANVQAITGYRHLNNRNLSVFNEFSKQLKGEAKSNPEFQKSMQEFGEKLGVVKEDLKVRTKKTTETIYKSVDGVWSEAEETSKKVTANIKEKVFAAKEEVKESFGLGKEESTTCKDGSPGASKHERTEASSHSDGTTKDATSSHTLFTKLKSTISSASPVVSGAFAKLKDTRVSTLAKQGYEIVKDELSSTSSRKKKHQARHASAKVEKSTRTDLVIMPTKKSVLGEKWESFKNKIRGHPVYKRVDEYAKPVVTKGQEVTANIKEKVFAAKEEVKESFGLGKEESTTCKDGSPGASKHERTEASSHSDGTTKDATSSHTLFTKLKSTISSASPVVSGAFAKLKDTRVSTLAKQGYEIVKDELSSTSSRKKKHQARHASAKVEKSTRTDLVIMPTKKSVLGEKWESFKNKIRGHPVYKRVDEYAKPVVTKGQEVAEDVRERWETSDNPVVQKIQDLNESLLEETSSAVTFREIRQRDPSFSLSDFVADVQEMIKPVLTAYSKGDVEALKKYCTKEVIERCKGERQAYASQGIFFDHKILHISEADVSETKMFGSSPMIILRFQTQQIYCVRDREGQVTEGGQDTIQTVFYSWAMQLMDSDEVPEEESYYPVWRLREMQQAGIKALI